MRIAILLGLLPFLLFSCTAKIEPSVNITKAVVADTAIVKADTVYNEGNVFVEVIMDIIHPRVIDFNIDLQSSTEELYAALATSTIYLVVKRDDRIITVFGQDGEHLNSNRMARFFDDITFDQKTRKISNIRLFFIIPEELRNDELHLMIGDIDNFAYSATTKGGVEQISYGVPSDIWFDYTDFKR